jgi:two-component system, OmpR family, alkaline phosphatase synthesis response regulator PhoP
MSSILVIEDNANLAFGLRNNLEIEGHDVVVAVDGGEALARARATPPDLVILDLMLPDLDGFRVLRALRDGNARVPILILTARGAEGDKVRGLRLGADDYMTKPFSVLELLARIDALLRRATGEPGARARSGAGGAADGARRATAAVERFGEIRVDPRRRLVSRSGEAVALTPKEYDLLLALMARRGAVASRRELLREVWGYPASVTTRTLDTHIAELRRKLERDPTAPRHILTVRKTGYRLEPR